MYTHTHILAHRPQYESINGSDMEMSVEKGKEGERAAQVGSSE